MSVTAKNRTPDCVGQTSVRESDCKLRGIKARSSMVSGSYLLFSHARKVIAWKCVFWNAELSINDIGNYFLENIYIFLMADRTRNIRCLFTLEIDLLGMGYYFFMWAK